MLRSRLAPAARPGHRRRARPTGPVAPADDRFLPPSKPGASRSRLKRWQFRGRARRLSSGANGAVTLFGHSAATEYNFKE